MTDGIRLDCVRRQYDLGSRRIRALDDIGLFVESGSFTVIVGQSGCGKTTLLRVLAGLEQPDAGRITFYRKGCPVAREEFGLGLVFQEPRLMPWLTVEENLSFSLRGKITGDSLKLRVGKLLEQLGLKDFRSAYPHQISGGMAQRTALGRTLAFDPEVILMDEPFGALDYFTRRTLQQEMVRLHSATGKTFLFVTHDVEEALALGHEVLVMTGGRITERIPIVFPHPRETGAPQYQSLRARILNAIACPESQF